MKLGVSLILALVVLVLDFVTKRWVESELFHGEQIPVTSFFNLVLTYNAGAAFSFLSDAAGWHRWFFSAIAGGASVLIIYLLRKHETDKLFCIALSLILGGAVGNLGYLNRLSDLLFVLCRILNRQHGVPDVLWQPGKTREDEPA